MARWAGVGVGSDGLCRSWPGPWLWPVVPWLSRARCWLGTVAGSVRLVERRIRLWLVVLALTNSVLWCGVGVDMILIGS